MKNTQSMKLNKDFRRLYYRGKSVVKPNVVVYAAKNKKGVNTLGLTCGKTVGKAVKRNRSKRLMREAYRLIETNLNLGYDIVLVARTKSAYSKCVYVKQDLESAFEMLGMLKK